MKDHNQLSDLLPLYVSGALDPDQRRAVEKHLRACAECQADLALWTAVSGEIAAANQPVAAPPALAEQALDRIYARSGLALAFLHTAQLLRTQAFLVQSEMWPSSAVIMAMGVVVALLAVKVNVIFFLAPLVSAATLAVIYGPDHDPALELSLSTPTSPWKILLARLSIVSAYNLLLALLATLFLLSIIPAGMLGAIILGWLGPLTFLSALALLLSIWLGTNSAISIAYGLWLCQYIPFKTIGLWMNSPVSESIQAAYQQFWHTPLLLLALSLLLVIVALWSANRPVFRLTQLPG